MELEALEADWDKGLPPDVLAMIAQTGGLEEMKTMRGVSKSWQQGFELGVKGILIFELEDPGLPSGMEDSGRFPGLARLDLGKSKTSSAGLGRLQAFPDMANLILGNRDYAALGDSLPHCIVDADMVHLRVRTVPWSPKCINKVLSEAPVVL